VRKAAVSAVLAMALVPALLVGSAGAGQGVRAPEDCTDPVNRPDRIVLACADFSLFLNTIHWDVWKSNKAKGEGFLQINDCDPSCARGTFHSFPVNIRLDKPKTTICTGGEFNMFRKAFLKFPGAEPERANRYQENKLFCDIAA
jgi:hypothetical protein